MFRKSYFYVNIFKPLPLLFIFSEASVISIVLLQTTDIVYMNCFVDF